MIILSVTPAKRHLTIIKLSEAFTCDDALLDDAGNLLLQTEYYEELRLREGMDVDEDWLVEVCHESAYRRALSKAMWYLSRRDHCSGELRKKLLSDYTDIVCDRVSARLQELGLLNDVAYAERLAEHFIVAKGVAPRQAVLHMAAKGVDMSLAKEVVSAREDDPKIFLKALVEKKYLRSIDSPKAFRKTVSSLVRKGYTYRDIKAVLEEFDINFSDDEFGD